MRRTIVVCAIIVAVAFNPCRGAADEFAYKVINSANGLSNGGINNIYQDMDGMIWFSTWDGLNRYDGREIRVYKANPKDSCSLADNIVQRVVQRHNDELWVESHHALNRIDLKTGRVTRYFDDADVNHIVNRHNFRTACNGKYVFCLVRGHDLYYLNDNNHFGTSVSSVIGPKKGSRIICRPIF